MHKSYPVYHGRNHVIRVQDRTEVLISTDRCTMGTTLERDKSALDIYKLIIRSLPRATSRQWQTPRKFQTRWRSPPRDAERQEEISARKCGKIDIKMAHE